MEWIPMVNACLNSTATVLLLCGFIAVKKQKIEIHRKMMASALVCSALFLGGYLTHKILRATAGVDVNSSFQGTGIWRWVYYPMLITHLILAIAILPMIFMTVIHAIKNRFDQHKKWAKITWPLWMYVSITGVLVYFFLYQWFPHA